MKSEVILDESNYWLRKIKRLKEYQFHCSFFDFDEFLRLTFLLNYHCKFTINGGKKFANYKDVA
jgi:hypothetical protein